MHSEGKGERQRREKDAKCKHRLETVSPESSRPLPATARTQTAGHTPAGPLKVREHTAKWGSGELQARGRSWLPHPQNGGRGRARGPQQIGLGLSAQKCQPPSMPTSPAPVTGQRSVGRHQAGPETPAHGTVSCVRLIGRTGEHKSRWRNAEGGARQAGHLRTRECHSPERGRWKEQEGREVGSGKAQSNPTPQGWRGSLPEVASHPMSPDKRE